MSVFSTVVAANIPYGNPRSLGEPLGLWLGQSLLTGDASGGLVEITFVPQNPTDTPTLPDQRREYCYFVDGLEASTDGVDPDTFSADIFYHGALSNIALTLPFRHRIVRNALDSGGGIYLPDGPLMPPGAHRTPIFWDNTTLGIAANQLVRIRARINTNTQAYEFNAYGRFYDRQVLSNRSFGRLVAPPPLAPGE